MIGAEITIAGPRPLRGTVRVPGDKGISHRALLSAALASGRSTIRGLADGDDVQRTRGALEQLGVRVKDSEPSTVAVLGTGAEGLREPDALIDCGNSGTTMRMLAGLLVGRPFLSLLAGDSSLQARPMGRVARPLRTLGARVDGRMDGELAPLVIRGGGLTGRRIELDVVSAQVKTAVILAGLQAERTTEVVEPAPLVTTTIRPDEGMIDVIPVLAVAAAFADGVTEIQGVAELRVKESDRVKTIEQELTQMGVGVETKQDVLTIRVGKPRPAMFKSHGDHRIALAAAVAANAMPGESTVRGWHSVAVSYPRFADDLGTLTGGNGS